MMHIAISCYGKFCCAEFHDDLEHNTFGKIVKNNYYPASDFRFDLMAKVICCQSENTGYIIINVYPERVGDEEVNPM